MLIYTVFSVKPYLHDVSHARIAKEKASDPQPINSWQRHKAEVVGKRRIGQDGANDHDQRCCEQEKGAGDALEKGNARGAYNVNDKRLSQDRLNEPSSMKEAFVIGLHCRRRGGIRI